jgi:hypothetical protein
MSTEWYCKIMGEERGPISTAELVTVARRGPLTRNDVVRRGASGTWVRAEVVDGLFEKSVPTTGTPKPTVQGRGAPAKRSVSHKCARKYWVQLEDRTAGPFTAAQLRYLAVHGKLKPQHLVSDSRLQWVRAGKIPGLCLQSASATAAAPAGTAARRPLPASGRAT